MKTNFHEDRSVQISSSSSLSSSELLINLTFTTADDWSPCSCKILKKQTKTNYYTKLKLFVKSKNIIFLHKIITIL